MFPGRKFPDRKPSAVRLRELLTTAAGGAIAMYQTEAIYHAQVEWTCQVLGVIDEVTDPETAERITDAIAGRLTGDGGETHLAMARIRDAQAEFGRLVWQQHMPGG
jgi:hypothetical protein